VGKPKKIALAPWGRISYNSIVLDGQLSLEVLSAIGYMEI
jgi:hypothetical protein